jgi:hypothetical protein
VSRGGSRDGKAQRIALPLCHSTMTIRIVDRRLQREPRWPRRPPRSRGRSRTGEHRVQRRRLDDSRKALDHGVGEQVFAGNARECVGRERRLARRGHELGALERHLEQVLLQLVIVLE